MNQSISCEQIAAELRAMLDVASTSPSLVQRTLKQPLTVSYEFLDQDAIRPFHLRLAGGVGTLQEGALDYEQCDVVVRTTPLALHRILNGDLGGREAVVSGILDVRKAPSMAKLMQLRALFNRYLKARKRGELTDERLRSYSPEALADPA
jgi:hypothetical protein